MNDPAETFSMRSYVNKVEGGVHRVARAEIV